MPVTSDGSSDNAVSTRNATGRRRRCQTTTPIAASASTRCGTADHFPLAVDQAERPDLLPLLLGRDEHERVAGRS